MTSGSGPKTPQILTCAGLTNLSIMNSERLSMYILVPSRYQSPKWQASVIPRSQAFRFSDGTLVVNLFTLKQALSVIDDSYLQEQVNGSVNYLADWIATCIGDTELATLMRQQPHRWGMIVALERHLMRTLNLPAYVAQRWLRPTAFPFVFLSGESANSLTELQTALAHVTDATIDFHLERYPNDLALWVDQNIGDQELAELFNECSNRLQMLNYLTDHLEMLKEAA